MPSGLYVVDRSKVVHDTIDGETIIINLENGSYFSLNQVGSKIWLMIQEGRNLDQIKLALTQEYGASSSEIDNAADEFIIQLVEQGLIFQADHQEKTEWRSNSIREDAKAKFESPKLEVFTDMQDFLLVDPIHEVDEEGWPYRKRGQDSDKSKRSNEN